MGDEQERHAFGPGEVLQEVEDLGLRRDVERGGRFVRDQEAWLQRDGHGDDDPLPLPAGKLVRIASGRDVEAHLSQQSGHVGGHGAMDAENLCDLVADGLERVERGHRFLEDHADLAPADAAQVAVGEAGEVGIAETYRARGHGRGRQEPHDGERGERLA